MYTEEEIQAMSENLENLENQITALKAERAKIVYKLTALKSYRETRKVAYNTRSNVWEWFGQEAVGTVRGRAQRIPPSQAGAV